MRAIAASAVAGALLGSAGLAAAQAPQGPAPSQGSDFPTLLHLRPDQMTAYHAVEAAGRESPTVIAQLRAKQQHLLNATTPQRLDFEAERMDLEVAHEHRVWAALRKFYAVLTPEQQHTFDQLTAPHAQQGAPQH
jgi:hypothetical protein